VPDPTLADLVPEDVPRLLRLLPTADLYLQVQVGGGAAPHPDPRLVPQGPPRTAPGGFTEADGRYYLACRRRFSDLADARAWLARHATLLLALARDE
jgi:hypothetical protein